MSLSVRLDPALEAALEAHCAATGSSKSLIVQQSLAQYLVTASSMQGSQRAGKATRRREPLPSANHLAFSRAGLLGRGHLGSSPATKEAVRRRVTGR